MSRSLTILGSTGSIGTQALDVVRANPDSFEVRALSAGGSNIDLLARQALEFTPDEVALSTGEAQSFQDALQSAATVAGRPAPPVHVHTGADASTTLAANGADVVLNGITGSVGLLPTLAALGAGSTLALANKESLIAGGPLVRAAAQRPDQIVPVDSEHSAMAQCLRAGRRDEVRRLILTASGGPFRGKTRGELGDVTPAQALAHPTWAMGPVVTTNSATLVNKGLELIEAHLLFDVDVDDITVVVHPQSIVHSMVEFIDGSTIAQASPPDMRLPIALGLQWPDRVAGAASACRWDEATSWTFEPLDDEAFPAVSLARSVAREGSTYPAVYNAANEECVAAFFDGDLPFTGIVDTVAQVVSEHRSPATEVTLESVRHAETWARTRAKELIAGA